MTYLDAIILGILQGLTEFLPISSSGHLVLTEALLGVKQPGVSFELLVHVGTLLAVLCYFRTKILLLVKSVFVSSLQNERKWIGYLILGTLPAGLAGVLMKDFFEEAFSSPFFTSIMMLCTGFILLSTRVVKHGQGTVSFFTAIGMGIGQALAIFPGISRSGTTISVGMIAGVKPSEAAEFSFLLAIPAILGAVVLKRHELLALEPSLIGQYMIGMVFAFLLGLLAISGLLSVIRRGKFAYFAYYCFAVGCLGLYLFR